MRRARRLPILLSALIMAQVPTPAPAQFLQFLFGQPSQPSAPAPAPSAPRPVVRPAPAPGTGPSATQPNMPEGPPPPYEPQLLRLSEIMGALTYLRNLCGDNDGDSWRTQMRGLLDAEAQAPNRRERLAGAYNRGFRGYEIQYRACTPNARVVIQRFLDEGERLARDVTGRFGNS
jgi:uncharacterized protein (TIGR02301 family)